MEMGLEAPGPGVKGNSALAGGTMGGSLALALITNCATPGHDRLSQSVLDDGQAVRLRIIIFHHEFCGPRTNAMLKSIIHCLLRPT
jgi:hypothetical protein